MIQTKLFEVRDSMTFIPVIASRMVSEYGPERYLLGRVGYGTAVPDHIFLARLAGGTIATADPYEWNSRTMQAAHGHIMRHWNELASGDVVDVEYILGKTNEPKKSERVS